MFLKHDCENLKLLHILVAFGLHPIHAVANIIDLGVAAWLGHDGFQVILTFLGEQKLWFIYNLIVFFLYLTTNNIVKYWHCATAFSDRKHCTVHASCTSSSTASTDR